MSILSLEGKNGKKTFRAIVYNKATKKNDTKSFKTKPEAKRWEISRKNQINNFQSFSPSDIKDKTINDLVDMYVFAHPNSVKKESTEKQYINETKRIFGKYIYIRLSAQIIQEELQKEADAGLKHNSVLKKFKELRKIINWVRKQPAYQLPIHCCEAVEWKHELDERAEIYSAIELTHIYKVLDEQAITPSGSLFRDLFTCLLNTGCRVGELLKLEMKMVDLKNKVLILPPRILKGKPTTGRQAILTSPTIPILTRLTSQKEKVNNFVFKKLWAESTVVSKRFREVVLPKALENYLDECNTTKTPIDSSVLTDKRLHDLRHTFTYWCYMKPKLKTGRTMTDLEVAALTGHADLKSLKRYANLKSTDYHDVMW